MSVSFSGAQLCTAYSKNNYGKTKNRTDSTSGLENSDSRQKPQTRARLKVFAPLVLAAALLSGGCGGGGGSEDGLEDNPPGKTIVEEINGVNGIIDEPVSQGHTGDCSLITAVLSLASTEYGREIIKDSIEPHDDGTVTVHFKGVNKSYEISQEEIEAHDTDDNLKDEYSNGDNDMLVIELAAEKYDKEKNGRESLDGFYPLDLYKMMIPAERLEASGLIRPFKPEDDNTAPYMKEEALDALKYKAEHPERAVSFSINPDIIDNFCLFFKLIDGSKFFRPAGHHAYTVTDVSSDGIVTFLNTWDSAAAYQTKLEELKKTAAYVYYADIKPAANE